MILKLAEVWNVPHNDDPENWRDEYEHQLFLAKKELRSCYQIPKLFNKKWIQYHEWAQWENPGWSVHPAPSVILHRLEDFEKDLVVIMNRFERVGGFTDLVQLGLEWMALMEGYKDLICRLTEIWSNEWLHVEVNSRENFPLGAFLYGIKQGALLADWKLSLLKERKRISIVY